VSHILRDFAAVVAGARVGLLLVALALHAAGLVVTGERWRMVIAALGGRTTLWRSVFVNLAGIFVRNVTPTTGLGGDATRVALLRADGLPVSRGTAAFAYVRLAEAPPIALLVVAATPSIAGAVSRSTTMRIAALVTMAVVAWLVWSRRGSLKERFAALWRQAQTFWIGSGTAALAVGYATLAQVETIARLMVVAAAFGVRLTIAQAVTITVLTIAGGLVPTVGSIGAIDGSLVAGLMMFGIGAETAAAITLAERAISYGFSTAAGAVALASLGGRRLLQAASDAGTRRAAL
jgi:uncharacterized membrane protein YbhN (UPF0104 family)